MFRKQKEFEIIDFHKEMKKRERKQKVADGFHQCTDWVRSNLDVLMFVVPIGAGIVGGTTKLVTKAIQTHNINKEIRFKETTIYDHSLGRYCQLKRKLTPAQALTIEERRAGGEKLNTILEDMNLLKH